MRKRPVPPPPDKPVRFIPCNENSQTFNWQKTNGIGSSLQKTPLTPESVSKRRKRVV